MKYFLRAATALAAIAGLIGDAAAYSGSFNGNYDPHAPWRDGFSAYDDSLPLAQKLALLRKKVKYVFVIFHENNSFDHFFGTFPGANGLFSAPKGFTPGNQTAGFTQKYLTTALAVSTLTPFLMPQGIVNASSAAVTLYPADEQSMDHSHQGIANSMHVDPVSKIAGNDRYSMNAEGLTTDANGNIVQNTGVAATSVIEASVQLAENVVSHLDCDTIPFMWSWARNFVLFDNMHQTIVGPSTPNAIAIVAGQSGQTQWALHPTEGASVSYANPNFTNVRGASYLPLNTQANTYGYVPLVTDPNPFPGSALDTSAVKPPGDSGDNNPSLNLTFATQPLSFMGSNIETLIKSDENPVADLLDIQRDIKAVAAFDKPVNWGWYQQGFDAADNNAGYVAHHNAPQYFGYLGDNTAILGANLHGAADFFAAVENRTLPAAGGVFYLRGGMANNDGLVPVDPTAGVKSAFQGNDDHPAYSDQQISEAFAARAITDIASSPYWAQSAIVITYDETDGFYDHEQPHVRNTFVDGAPLAGGPRIPTIVISPYAATGKISHRYSEHGSLIKFINELKGLVPLAALPDEERGVVLGKANLGQNDLGPSDDPDNELGDFTEAFDYKRLAGLKPPLSASLATFTADQIKTLPHLAGTTSANGYTNGACKTINVLPTDFASWQTYQAGAPIDPAPQDVNPRPLTSSGIPYNNGANPWVP